MQVSLSHTLQLVRTLGASRQRLGGGLGPPAVELLHLAVSSWKYENDGAGLWQFCLSMGQAEELWRAPLPTLTMSLWYLQGLLRKYYLGTPVSPVPLKVVLALEQLR